MARDRGGRTDGRSTGAGGGPARTGPARVAALFPARLLGLGLFLAWEIMLAQGNTPAQVEAALCISYGTMRSHLQHVYAKHGVHSYEEVAEVVHAWE